MGHPEEAVATVAQDDRAYPRHSYPLSAPALVPGVWSMPAPVMKRARGQVYLPLPKPSDTPERKVPGVDRLRLGAFHDADPLLRTTSSRRALKIARDWRLPVAQSVIALRPVAASRRPARSRGSLRLFNHRHHATITTPAVSCSPARPTGDPRHSLLDRLRALSIGRDLRRIRRRSALRSRHFPNSTLR